MSVRSWRPSGVILQTDLRAGKSPALMMQGFHRTDLQLLLLFSSKKQRHRHCWEVKGGRDERARHGYQKEREGWELYSRAFWEGALLSGLSGCQDEAKVHHWSATETADVEHLVFPPLTLHISICLCLSLSLSLLSHMLALPDSQPPLWIWFHSLHTVVMVTKISALQFLSPVMGARIWYFCSLTFPHRATCRGRTHEDWNW